MRAEFKSPLSLRVTHFGVLAVSHVDDGRTRHVATAQRRRERQLRAFHRHEVLSVKMALATGPPPQRASGWRSREMGRSARRTLRHGDRSLLPPGTRPASQAEPRGDVVQVQRHTVEQFGELAPTLSADRSMLLCRRSGRSAVGNPQDHCQALACS